jgi:hypothetical protein
VFENRVLKRIFGHKRDEVARWEVGENCMMRSFIICTLNQIFLDTQFKEDQMGGWRKMRIGHIIVLL